MKDNVQLTEPGVGLLCYNGVSREDIHRVSFT